MNFSSYVHFCILWYYWRAFSPNVFSTSLLLKQLFTKHNRPLPPSLFTFSFPHVLLSGAARVLYLSTKLLTRIGKRGGGDNTFCRSIPDSLRSFWIRCAPEHGSSKTWTNPSLFFYDCSNQVVVISVLSSFIWELAFGFIQYWTVILFWNWYMQWLEESWSYFGIVLLFEMSFWSKKTIEWCNITLSFCMKLN